MLNKYADIIHLDVMDGSLVQNISFGFSVISAIAPIAEKPMDVHLMIVNPDKYFGRCAELGASMVSFHLEASRKARKSAARMLDNIRSLGMKAGLAINPDIPVQEVFPYIKHADYILVMSVFAGFGGQQFIEDTFKRVSSLKEEIMRQGAGCMIQIDGGASLANASAIYESGADIIVAGSAVFKAEDPGAMIEAMKA